jgi:hypothetical protein
MYSPNVINSPTCSGTPHVPDDGTCGVPEMLGNCQNLENTFSVHEVDSTN